MHKNAHKVIFARKVRSLWVGYDFEGIFWYNEDSLILLRNTVLRKLQKIGIDHERM